MILITYLASIAIYVYKYKTKKKFCQYVLKTFNKYIVFRHTYKIGFKKNIEITCVKSIFNNQKC
ncbi:MAG TPA: hypothetical protein DCO89_01945 [Clostridiales bacterium]|nr:hypothetical protein [Clostridiales bacterium]